MNANEPTVEAQVQGRDDLDRLLSSFFQSEVPDPFPSAPLPQAAARPVPASRLPGYQAERVLSGPRVSLAVSVALLLGGCWLLSQRTSDAPVPPRIGKGIDDGSAKNKLPHEIPSKSSERPALKPMP